MERKTKLTFKKVHNIINKLDPLNLGDFPKDEYDNEAQEIFKKLPKCKSLDEVLNLVYDTLNEAFYGMYSISSQKILSKKAKEVLTRDREIFREIAKKLYDLIR